MRAVIQRVSSAHVSVDGTTTGSIGEGLVLLIGVAVGDDAETASRLAPKCAAMRLFPDAEGRFDRSLIDIKGEALVVSQFTLLGDVRRGRRPSFVAAAPSAIAEPLVETFIRVLRDAGLRVATGRFGARMRLELVNEGPVTIVVDSADIDRPRR